MERRIENDTLALVPLGPKYEQFYVELANDPVIRERVNNSIPYVREQYGELLDRQSQKKQYVWIIEENGVPLGVLNFSPVRHSPQVFQGGYWLKPEAWGRGLMTRAISMASEYLFLSCEAKRIQAMVEPGNVPSMRVLEKCGFRNEGLLRSYFQTKTGKLLDVHMYALTLAG